MQHREHTQSHQSDSADSLLQVVALFDDLCEPDWLVDDANQAMEEVHEQVGMVLEDLSGRWRFVRVGANAYMHPFPLLHAARLANSCCRCCHCVLGAGRSPAGHPGLQGGRAHQAALALKRAARDSKLRCCRLP